jgi:hypothetical protein
MFNLLRRIQLAYLFFRIDYFGATAHVTETSIWLTVFVCIIPGH